MSKVLLIDSDVDAASTLSQFLSANGYRVSTVTDGRSALVHLKQQKVDIILMAAELPQANGYALCNRIKKDPNAAAIPLVIFSASANAEATFAKHQALPTHAELYMRKPIKLETLLVQMRDLLTGGGQNTLLPSEQPTKRPGSLQPGTARAEGATTIYTIPKEFLERAKEPEATRVVDHSFVPKAFDEECTISASQPSPLPAENSASRNEEHQALIKENRELKAQLRELRDSIQNKEIAMNDRLVVETGKGREVLTLKKELNAAEAQLAEKDEQYNIAAERLEKLAEKTHSLLTEREELRNRLDEINSTLKRERHIAEANQSELMVTIDHNRAQLDSLQDEIAGLENRLTEERQKGAKAQQALALAMQLIQDAGLLDGQG